jgi:hypothetical protein
MSKSFFIDNVLNDGIYEGVDNLLPPDSNHAIGIPQPPPPPPPRIGSHVNRRPGNSSGPNPQCPSTQQSVVKTESPRRLLTSRQAGETASNTAQPRLPLHPHPASPPPPSVQSPVPPPPPPQAPSRGSHQLRKPTQSHPVSAVSDQTNHFAAPSANVRQANRSVNRGSEARVAGNEELPAVCNVCGKHIAATFVLRSPATHGFATLCSNIRLLLLSDY